MKVNSAKNNLCRDGILLLLSIIIIVATIIITIIIIVIVIIIIIIIIIIRHTIRHHPAYNYRANSSMHSHITYRSV